MVLNRLYSRWVPLNYVEKGKVENKNKKTNSMDAEEKTIRLMVMD